MTLQIRPVLVAASTAIALLMQPVVVQSAESLAGAYLAANQANYDGNYVAAARYFTEALKFDPKNPELLQNALIAYIGKGDLTSGKAIAQRLENLKANSQLAQLVLLAENIRKGDFGAAKKAFGKDGGFSPLLDGLMKGWIELGLGRMSQALDSFDSMAGENQAMRAFADYHKALALATVGDFEKAEKILRGKKGIPLRIGRGSLIAHIEILSQLDRNEDALKVIDDVLNGSGDPQVTALRDRVRKGETLPFDVVSNAREGAAEVFLSLASVLSDQQNDRFGLIYGRLAEYLRPDFTRAILLVADILDNQGQYDLAVAEYNKVAPSDPSFYNAEIGRASALQSAGKSEAAIEVLRNLSKAYPKVPSVFVALGDALRREKKFAEANKAYDRAIALLTEPQPNHWFIYYSRGITYERENQWDKAEADFRFALSLSPDQPLVLNYLGYGLVEKGIKMDEAQKMIKKAVKLRPNDAYITDSLGWVYYRLGKYQQAVPILERAVQLKPLDPIINDHLGDAYWMVGRRLEAEFQWRRALSAKPEEKDAKRIKRKLEVGLDQVRKEESVNQVAND
ncbi:MAG: tetratricopeptide repeat protein [Paracoccaceae bacterium]|nr:tetratricopeptide repeat protein [Paracoccaceae bacterium]